MSREALRGIAPLEHLEEFEELIGLPFFSNLQLEEMLHADPSLINPSQLKPRLDLYHRGMPMLADWRGGFGPDGAPEWETDDDMRQLVREEYAETIGEIRGELMTLDPGLETPAVRELRIALQTYRISKRSDRPHKQRRVKCDVLPPDRITVRSLHRIVNLKLGGAYRAMIHRDMPMHKLRLPGPSRFPIICCDWEFVRLMADLHGLREGVEIDWEDLPRGPDDRNPQRVAYARRLQRTFMPDYQLSNIPGLRVEQIPEPNLLPRARLFHISRNTLAGLLGGGYHFIDKYCEEQSISLTLMQRHKSNGCADYMRMEEAATIWQVYNGVPWATEDDIPLARLAQLAGLARVVVLAEHATSLERPQIQPMRALNPSGRVLDHVPRRLGDILIGRVRQVPLPPHLLPAGVIEKLMDVAYSAIMKRQQFNPQPVTPLRLPGSPQWQSCFDWQTIRGWQGNYQSKPPVKLDKLPRGPNETDQARIDYARRIQARLVPPEMLDESSFPPAPRVVPEDIQDSPLFVTAICRVPSPQKKPTSYYGALFAGYISLQKYARLKGVHIGGAYQFAKRQQIPVTTIMRGKKQINIISPDSQQLLDESLAAIPVAPPGWYTARKIHQILKGSRHAVLWRIPKGSSVDMRPAPSSLRTLQHYPPLIAAEIAHNVLAAKLAKEPGAALSPDQIALAAHRTPDDVVEQAEELGIPLTQTEYAGEALRKIVQALGIDLPSPAKRRSATSKARGRPRGVKAQAKRQADPLSEDDLAVIIRSLCPNEGEAQAVLWHLLPPGSRYRAHNRLALDGLHRIRTLLKQFEAQSEKPLPPGYQAAREATQELLGGPSVIAQPMPKLFKNDSAKAQKITGHLHLLLSCLDAPRET